MGIFGTLGHLAGEVFSPQRWMGNDPTVEWADPNQQRMAMRNALFNAGAGMVQAAGTSTAQNPVSPLAAIASGLQIGRNEYQQHQEGQRERNRRAQAYAPLTQGGQQLSRADLLNMFVRASQMGDTDTMRSVSEMLKSGALQSNYRFIDSDRGLFVGNEDTGEVRPAIPGQGGASAASVRGRQLRTYVNADGNPEFGWFNPNDNSVTPVRGIRPTVNRTEAQSKAYAFLAMLNPLEQAGRLNNITPNDIPGVIPNIINNANSTAAYFAIRDPRARAILLDAGMYAEAFLRITTGAAYNMNEFRNAMRQFTPLPGDDAAILQQKAARRSNLMRVLSILGAPGGITGEDAAGGTVVDPDAVRQQVGVDERGPSSGTGTQRGGMPTRDANGRVRLVPE